MTRIAIAGAAGRMGKALIEATQKHPHTTLGAATVRTGSSLVGVDAGELGNVGKLGITLVDNIAAGIDQFDVL
ncbi:MAG TPA: 4-hydroxy-tetrahydrodipicolinate reductase, partial [Cellvibrio sp.]